MKGYNYSKDYDALYEFICAGNEAIYLIDSECDLDRRDICKCILLGDIISFINGHKRAIIPLKLFKKDEFIKECNRLNVEWIIPY